MHKRSIRSATLLLCFGSSVVHAQPTSPALSQIATAGAASIAVPGDRVTVRVSVARRAGTAVEASRQMGPAVSRVQDTLRTAGTGEERLKVEFVTISPITGRPNERLTYEARTTLALTTTTFELLPRILDAFLAAGVNEIPSLSFQSDSLVAVRRRALAQAVRIAREEAEVIAAAMGGRLGRVIEMSTVEGGGDFTSRGTERIRLGFTVQVPDSAVNISASVRARWEFLPGS